MFEVYLKEKEKDNDIHSQRMKKEKRRLKGRIKRFVRQKV
jgi:hypothetical protein